MKFWTHKDKWYSSAYNTLVCLIGCAIGDFGTILYFQLYTNIKSILVIMPIAIINGILTSIILETIILLKILEKELGYKVYHNVLNSRDFGVPQNRERLFIICFKNKNKKFEWPLPLHRKKIVKDILEKRVHKKYTISNLLWSSHKARKIRNKKNGKGFGYNLIDSNNEYTNTMSARYYKDGAEILLKQKNQNPRKVTPREAARLQGFPDTFKIPVSDNQAYKQFGNTVCIPVIEALLLQIAKVI